MNASDGGKKPSCYGWFDRLDPSCRRCAVREACSQEQTKTRPICFAELYDGTHPECMKCLDNSQCSEEFEKMAAPTPKIRIKRPAAAAAVAEPEEEAPVAEEPEVEEEAVPETAVADEDEEVGSTYDDMSIDELRAELVARKLDATGRRSVLVERLEQDDAKPVAKQTAKQFAAAKTAPAPAAKPVVKPVPAPAPKPAVKPVAKPAAKVAEEEDEEPAPKAAPAAKPVVKPVPVPPKAAPVPIPVPDKVDGGAGEMIGATVKDVLEAMGTGMVVVIAREGKNEWTMTLMNAGDMPATKATAVAAVTSGPKLKGDAYWAEVLSPEYFSWYYEDAGNGKGWENMTPEEKEEVVTALGIEYEPHEDPRVNSLHQVTALLKHLGIRKYKPEYQTTKARDALRG